MASAPHLVSIAVTPATPSVAVGVPTQFTATGDFEGGTYLPYDGPHDITSVAFVGYGPAIWASSDAGVAEVNPSVPGQVVAVGPGTANITATDPLTHIQGMATLTATGSGPTSLITSYPGMGLRRTFYQRFREIDPQEWFSIGLFGNGQNGNLLTVPTNPSETIALNSGFSGTPFSFSAPASVSASQLGVIPGDKLLLVGPGTNTGRIFTIQEVWPGALVVSELTNAESAPTNYTYTILRRTS
jgi:hypothetical protein